MNPMVKSVQSLLVLMFFVLLLSVKANASFNPEELVGEYLGTNDCGVVVELYGDDQLELTIVRAGKKDFSELVPFYKFEELNNVSSFNFEKEITGVAGREKRSASGTIVAKRLRSLSLSRVRSIFSQKRVSCDGLAPLMPYMP